MTPLESIVDEQYITLLYLYFIFGLQSHLADLRRGRSGGPLVLNPKRTQCRGLRDSFCGNLVKGPNSLSDPTSISWFSHAN